MRVAMYYNNRDVRLEEMPVPEIGPNEILVKTMASGICGSDVMEWYRIKKAPIVLGHEITGEIVKIGAGVRNYAIGERVFAFHHVPCNVCQHCLNGNHTACETLHTTNFDPGGFSEFIRVPALNVDRGVFKLPRNLSYEDGTFLEPLACVLRGLARAGLKPGQNVLILGSGISGLLQLMAARALGAGKLVTTDINPFRLKKASELGADSVIPATEDVPRRFREGNGGRGADLVIVCADALSAFHQALDAVERGGTVLFFAPTGPNETLAVPVNRFWRNSVTLLPSYGNSPSDAATALALLQSGRIPVNRLITHRLGLALTAEGFRLMTQSGESLKVIIEPQN